MATPPAQVDGPTFACHCGSTFSRIENLVRHTKTHASERPWVCRVCDKAFTRPDLLKRHEKIHDRAKDGAVVGQTPTTQADTQHGGIHPAPKPVHEPTLAGYPYNRVLSPPRLSDQRSESYERTATRDDDGGYPRKRARRDSPHRTDVSSPTRLTSIALPVHRGIGHGATTLPSLSEGIIRPSERYYERESIDESRTPLSREGTEQPFIEQPPPPPPPPLSEKASLPVQANINAYPRRNADPAPPTPRGDDLQQNLIWDALGNMNSPMDQLHWGKQPAPVHVYALEER